MTKRIDHASQSCPSLATCYSAVPPRLRATDFFADLFIHLNDRMAHTSTAESKVQVLHEARQYLCGAQAFYACLAARDPAGNARRQAERLLVENLFHDAHVYMDEVQSELRPVSPGVAPPG